MKRTLLSLALLASFAATAQTTIDSTSGSASNSGAASQSGAAITSANSGNTSVTAVGNQAGSSSTSGSESGAISGSRSGALGNVINLDQSVPSSQTITSNVNQSGTTNQNSTTKNDSHVSGGTTNTDNVKYSGEVTNRNINEGTSTTRVEYSGTQTLKNVPSIAMSGPASGPCTGASGGLGLAGPGWGLGLNGSSVMADCRLRENARVLGMAMQSVDGAASPQEKGELMVLFMNSVRGLAAYNDQIISQEVKAKDAK